MYYHNCCYLFHFVFWVFSSSSSSPSLCLSRTWNDYYAKLNTIHLWTFLSKQWILKKNNKISCCYFGTLLAKTKIDEFNTKKVLYKMCSRREWAEREKWEKEITWNTVAPFNHRCEFNWKQKFYDYMRYKWKTRPGQICEWICFCSFLLFHW